MLFAKDYLGEAQSGVIGYSSLGVGFVFHITFEYVFADHLISPFPPFAQQYVCNLIPQSGNNLHTLLVLFSTLPDSLSWHLDLSG